MGLAPSEFSYHVNWADVSERQIILYFATKTNNTLCHYVLLYVAIYTNITVYAVAAGRRSIYKAQEHLRKDTNASSNIEL